MSACFSIRVGFLLVALICAASAGQAASPSSSERVAYCTKLYGLWNRYGHHPTYHHTGQRARAELALYRCQNGDYQPSIDVLDVVLEHNMVAIPPAPDMPRTPQFALQRR